MQMNQVIEIAVEVAMPRMHEALVNDTELEGCFVSFNIHELMEFADRIAYAKAEEIAAELEKGPVNDTAASIAIWIREQQIFIREQE